jgi:hypothetical protein
VLWDTFHQTIDRYDKDGEWRRAYECGAPFRRLADHLELGIKMWSDGIENWIDERLEWAIVHPGRGMPEELR